jgi:IS30 family transposase
VTRRGGGDGASERLITQAERRAILKLAARGASYRDIVAQLPEPMNAVMAVLRPLSGVIRHEWFANPSGFRLSLDERQDIFLGLKARESVRGTARRLGRAPSTISREVKASGGRDACHPHGAERRARRCASRPKQRKLEASPEVWRRVRGDLERLWSPQ